MQTTRNIVGCYTLRPFANPVACCRLGVVAQSLQPLKLLSNQLPTFLFFPVIAVAWIRLHSSSNIVGPPTRITPDLPPRVLWVVSFPRQCTVGLNIVGSCCIHLDTTTANTDATIPDSQQCWELFRPFAGSSLYREKGLPQETKHSGNLNLDKLQCSRRRFIVRFAENSLLIFNELTSALQ